MKFEDIQAAWNSQNDEKLFAVNEIALRASIQRKSRKISNLLELFEWIMIGLNLVTGFALIVDLLPANASGYQLVLPAAYLTFSAYAFLRRLRRHAHEVRFEPTLLGELDKAIWQINYLIRQGYSITIWYVLPLVLAVSIAVFYSQRSLWALLLTLALIPISYFGVRWEVNKWYIPKKRDLELLREKLISQEPPNHM